MPTFTRHDLDALAALRGSGLVSIYLPTARSGAATEQGRIRLKNLLTEAEHGLLALDLRRTEAHERLAPGHALLDDEEFWQHQAEGLALFITPDGMHQHRLPVQTNELVHVGSHLHLKPLVALLTGDGRFHVLALSQHDIRLFEGTRDAIREMTLEGVPRTVLDAVGHDVEQRTRGLRTVASGSGGRHQGALGHAHGTAREEQKEEVAIFLRQVDRGIAARLGNHGTPLVLAGVEYITAMYRKTSTCTTIVDPVIAGNPDALSATQLHAAAWPLVAARFAASEDAAIFRFREAESAGLASDDIREILRAVHEGRVALLLVALGEQRWGRYDAGTLETVLHAEAQQEDEDLLDTAAMAALRTDAEVHAVPMAQMPSGRTIAAVFRY